MFHHPAMALPVTCLPASSSRKRGEVSWPQRRRLFLRPVHGEKVPEGRMRGGAGIAVVGTAAC
jgi:hypothetical protein